MNHKVSIIIPVYNSQELIERAIRSCMGQTFANIEIIIVNDGSSDRTKDVLQHFECLNNVIILNKDNEGVAKARNDGLKLASGKYVIFLDADDYLKNDAAEVMVNTIIKEQSDMVVSGFHIIKSDSTPLHVKPKYDANKSPMDNFFLDNIVSSPWAKLFKMEIINNNNICFENLEIMEDGVFNVDYIQYVSKLAFIDEPLYTYIKGADGLSSNISESKCRSIMNALEMQERKYIIHCADNKITVNTDIIDARILRLGILFPLNSKSNCSVLKNKLKEYSLSRVLMNKYLGIHEKVLLLSYRIGLYPFIFTSAIMNVLKKSVKVFKRNFN
jgi:glycosyltransferase involved in cell wall biosynthesis